MFLTDKLLAAQRRASERVKQGKSYSVALPIVGRVPVPSPEQLAIYAALGGLVALELIDWPVALAMGVGSTVVSQRLSDLKAREEELAEAIEPAKAPLTKATPAKVAPETDAIPVQQTSTRPAAKKAPATKAATTKAPAKKAPAKRAPTKTTPPADPT